MNENGLLQLRVFEVLKHGIQQFFQKGASLSRVNQTDDIIV